MELLAAEAEAREKKRKAEGRPVEAPVKPQIEGPGGSVAMEVDDEANKRRKLLQEAIALDKDDDSDEDGEEKEKEERYVGLPSVISDPRFTRPT